MDSISPLAKILAEANGIDWRSIRGSGEGGSVVEQDILNYLSRVMSGDEEPPATPVDEAPPGWTGEMPPMPAMVAASGLQALSAAGVESDITDFVAQQAQPTPVQVSPVQVNPVQASAAETVVFRPSEVPPVAAAVPMPQPPEPAPAAFSEPMPPAPVELAPVGMMPAELPAEPDFEIGEPDEEGGADLEFELDDEALDEPEESLGDLGGAPDPAVAQPMSADLEPAAPGQAAYDPLPLDEEADFVLADSFPGADLTAAEPAPAAAPRELAQPEVAPAAPEPAPAASSFGLGGFLSRLYGAKAEPAPEPVQTEPAQPEAVQPEQAQPVQPAAEPAIGSAHSEPFPVPAAAAVAAPEPVQSEPVQPEPAQPEAAQPEPMQAEVSPPAEPLLGEPLVSQAPPIPDTPVAAPLVADQWRDQEAVPAEPEQAPYELEQSYEDAPSLIDHTLADMAPAAEMQEAEPAEVPDLHPAAEPLHADLGQPIALPEAHEGGLEAEALPDEPAPEAHSPEPAAEVDAPAAPALPEHAETETPGEAEPEPQEAPAAAIQPAVPQPSAVSPGAQAITLRLNVDLGVLETARAQLSEALYREVPVTLLVARAAARSLTTLGLTTVGLGTSGGVALADHAGQPLAADLSGDIRASLGGLGEPSHATPALLVLDAAGLGLDELHRGECSLSVGRSGNEGAALSLRGDLDAARGAQFLHEVAGLLNTPIRLLF